MAELVKKEVSFDCLVFFIRVTHTIPWCHDIPHFSAIDKTLSIFLRKSLRWLHKVFKCYVSLDLIFSWWKKTIMVS